MKVFSDGQNSPADDKMFTKLAKTKIVRTVFLQVPIVFPCGRSVSGAKSHQAGAPWWIMKVI